MRLTILNQQSLERQFEGNGTDGNRVQTRSIELVHLIDAQGLFVVVPHQLVELPRDGGAEVYHF